LAAKSDCKMEDFLKKIQLIQHKQIKLPIDKTAFLKAFKENVDEGEIGVFSGMFEAFSSSKNKFKGKISHSDFELRRRHVLFQRNQMFARVKGTFRQQADHVIVDLNINGFSKMMIPFYIFAILFYVYFISIIGFTSRAFDMFSVFIVIHGILMFVIPYVVMRNGVKNVASDIEKEFFFMTRKEPYNL